MKLRLFVLALATLQRLAHPTKASPITNSNTISRATSTTSSSQTTAASFTWRHGPGPSKLQTRAYNEYPVDPFGFLGDTGATPIPDGASSTTKQSEDTQTEAKKTAESLTDSTSSVSSSSSGSQSTVSAYGPNTIQATPSVTSGIASTVPTQTLVGQATSGTNSKNASASAVSTGSWKIVGIGVLSAIGIVVLVVGFIFHDKIFGVILHRGKDEELLVPDWKRGSWAAEGGEDEGPRISEKGAPLEFPLPPVSPFPLRRALSKTGNASATTLVGSDYGKEYMGGSSVRVQGSDFSIIPSPPPPVHISVTKTSMSGYPSSPLSIELKGGSSTQKAPPNDQTPEDDAYGGIAG